MKFIIVINVISVILKGILIIIVRRLIRKRNVRCVWSLFIKVLKELVILDNVSI